MTEPSGLSANTSANYGYCYVCDRQVTLSRTNDEMKCSVCNGGFVELFEFQQNPLPQQQQQTNTSGTSTLHQPHFMLFPEVVNQVIQQHHQQIHQQLHQQYATAAAAAGTANPNETTTTTTQTTHQQPNLFFRSFQQPTINSQRIEFIVPGGEQLDFYGMLNNVIGGILGPTTQRHGPIHLLQVHGNAGDYAWGPGGLDAIITQLLNQLETSGPAPATEAQIAALASEVITNDHLEKGDQCAICMDEYKLVDKTKKLPCKHYFHESCISEWLKLHGTCPVCRKTLNGEDTSQREYVRPPGANGNQATGSQAAASTSNNSATASNASSSNSNPPNNNNNNNNNLYDEMDFD